MEASSPWLRGSIRLHHQMMPWGLVRSQGLGGALGCRLFGGALLQNERMTRVAVDLWLVLQQQIEAWRLHVVSQTRIPEQVNLAIHPQQYRAH